MSNPKVSVMFMSYNHGLYIQRAMESVLNQTFQDFEIILSDDCSTDNTKEVISKFNDQRLKINYFTENQGATFNNQYIWKHSSGEYLALINSDDVWLPEHLAKSIAYLEENKDCGAVFSWADLIDEDDKIIDACCEAFCQPNRTQAEWAHHLFTNGNCLCHPSLVIRRKVYDEVGFYKLGFRQLPDYNMWTRMLNKYSLHILEEVLVYHRRCIKTGQNTSAPIIQNSIRDVNESFYTAIHYFDNMPNELFKEAFKSLFRDETSETTEELMCEKFFLFYDEKYYMKPVSKFASFIYLQGIYDVGDIAGLLKKKYHFQLKDIYELGASFDLVGLKQPSVLKQTENQNSSKKSNLWSRIWKRGI